MTDRTERIESALQQIRDPDADLDLFEAGLVEHIDGDGDAATVHLATASLDPATRSEITEAVLHAVDDIAGVDSVTIEQATETTASRTPGADAFDRVIAVASAKGGVGKSTVATHLACALAAEDDVALFDADIHGPNVPRLLDVSGPIQADEADNPMPLRHRGLDVMSIGLMESGAPLAWRGAMAHDAVSDLFANTAWRNEGTLVIDLPPGTGDVVLTTLQDVPVDGVVVVTTPFHTSVDDTARTVELFRDNGVPVLGVIENMTHVDCECCGERNDLFTGDAASLDAEVIAELPFDHELQQTPAPGAVPEVIEDLADSVRAEIATAGEVDAPDDAVDIRGLPPGERKDRVRSAFEDRTSGESFTLVSDRDPSPVAGFLAELASERPDCTVERATPDAWVLRTTHP